MKGYQSKAEKNKGDKKAKKLMKSDKIFFFLRKKEKC